MSEDKKCDDAVVVLKPPPEPTESERHEIQIMMNCFDRITDSIRKIINECIMPATFPTHSSIINKQLFLNDFTESSSMKCTPAQTELRLDSFFKNAYAKDILDMNPFEFDRCRHAWIHLRNLRSYDYVNVYHSTRKGLRTKIRNMYISIKCPDKSAIETKIKSLHDFYSSGKPFKNGQYPTVINELW